MFTKVAAAASMPTELKVSFSPVRLIYIRSKPCLPGATSNPIRINAI